MTSRAGGYARVTDALSLAALNDGYAGYVTSEKTWDGAGSTTIETLVTRGRAALDAYTEALRNLLGGLAS
ncbi:MAG TPA: hypothetical protein VFD88_00260 [Clostridia bacterium]|nr:hypothetical protein [Clostridia bacterium]